MFVRLTRPVSRPRLDVRSLARPGVNELLAMNDAIDVFARVLRAVPTRSRARGLARRTLFRSTTSRAQHPARTARRASRAENARAPRIVSGTRDARLTFSRASVARSRRVRARAVSRDAHFSDQRVSPRVRVARASRVARRRAMTRARRDVNTNPRGTGTCTYR